MLPTPATSMVEKLRSIVARDPKRMTLLASLAVVLFVLCCRQFFSGPATATASLIRRSMAAITESPVASSPALATNAVLDWIAKPRRPLNRNLFTIHLDYYARAANSKSAAGNADDSTTPLVDEDDQKREQRILMENLQSQSARLKLQTTLMGSAPRAMVNGQLLGIGDSVEGFTVIRIEARRIFVQQDGVTLELPMN